MVRIRSNNRVGILVGLMHEMRFDLMNVDLSIATRRKLKLKKRNARTGHAFTMDECEGASKITLMVELASEA